MKWKAGVMVPALLACCLSAQAGASLLGAGPSATQRVQSHRQERPGQRETKGEPSITHPAFPLLDDDGRNVISSRGPVSAGRTCGACHDTDFIATHSYHASVGLDEMSAPGAAPGSRAWDTSPGMYGKWDPLLYRYLTPPGDTVFDMGTADWIRTAGRLHAGGGPAARSRDGRSLEELPADAAERFAFDEETGSRSVWDWSRSGVTEFDCFLCHIPEPANDARIEAQRRGAFRWASTATLERTGLVTRRDGRWEWNDRAFGAGGVPAPGALRVVPPTSRHCGQCHGLVAQGDDPVIARYGDGQQWSTETTGLIFSPQRLSESGMNLRGKVTLSVPWDIHAERLVECSDCHFPLNDPALLHGPTPPWLRVDVRRPALEEFLSRPDHNFAKGRSSLGTVADDLDGTMRRCEDCHSVEDNHEWLPYKKRHMDRLLCEACHIPKVRAPVRRATDWTVLTADGGPRVEYRGVRGRVDDPAALVVGYTPVLLPRKDPDRNARLGPHNLITTWYWVHGNPPRPVRLYDLERAYFRDGSYDPEILRALDANGDGRLVESELVLDTAAKVGIVKKKLQSLGLADPRIVAEIQPYSLHHGVVTAGWATRDCTTCHSRPSVLSEPLLLASSAPGGAGAARVADTNALMPGRVLADGGAAFYSPDATEAGFYVLGHDRWRAIDTAGVLTVLLVLAAAVLHGGARVWTSRKKR